MKDILINNIKYKFRTNYKDDDMLRAKFNFLVQKIYNFDFESWYKSGCWTDNCKLYSLFDKNKIVSHITVNVIDFIVLGEKKQFVQLGTVMTDEQYRNQGLCRVLLEIILDEWENKCDMIYLFANDSVLDLYPKFGFVCVNEYQAVKKNSGANSPYTARKMNIDNIDDYNLLCEHAKNAVALFKISMQNNAGLVMFYCNYLTAFSLKENLFYIQGLNAIVVAQYEKDTLILYDILALHKIEIDDVINTLVAEHTKNIILRFMPIDSENYKISLFKEDDTLFVRSDKNDIFKNNKLIFPILSHT